MGEKKLLVDPGGSFLPAFGTPHVPFKRQRGGAIYLYRILVMKVLGLSCFYHDSAAALLDGPRILSAVQEERFTRIKHDPSFPTHSIQYCLKSNGLTPDSIDAVVFYEKPFLKFERLLETYLAHVPKGLRSFSKAIPLWSSEKIFQKKILIEHLERIGFSSAIAQKIFFSNHHLSHAASTFYCSEFAKALILVMDGVGEWAATSVFLGNRSKEFFKQHGTYILPIKEIQFPHSLGLLYSAFTFHLGFKVNSGEYKVMGLAPYGSPRFADLILDKFVHALNDGSYWLNQKYFNYAAGLTMTSPAFAKELGVPARAPEAKLEPVHMDLAASIQVVLEKLILNILRSVCAENPDYNNLCLAGGVALNCVANRKLQQSKCIKDIFIQPASGDAGGSLGAALAFVHSTEKPEVPTSAMGGSYLGPAYDDAEVEKILLEVGAVFKKTNESEVINTTAEALSRSLAVGWFQGGMEFGPRALGNRSILGDPRHPETQKKLNLKIKFRESFRPFAPAVLAEDSRHWFDYEGESPYMLLVADVRPEHRLHSNSSDSSLFGIDRLNIPRSKIPAVTHVDYSARLQTVSKITNEKFYKLIAEFKNLTGVPVLVNTSFNVRGEPIVCTPRDAWNCFMGTDLDLLVINSFILWKSDQVVAKRDYSAKFSLD